MTLPIRDTRDELLIRQEIAGLEKYREGMRGVRTVVVKRIAYLEGELKLRDA